MREKGYPEQAPLLFKKLLAKEQICIEVGTNLAEESAFAIGESKMGGIPHLPKGFAWPKDKDGYEPLSFVAQINLEEMTREVGRHLLPLKGFLYFFYEDYGECCVKYYAGSANDLVAADFPEDIQEHYMFLPCKLTFWKAKSYPDPGSNLCEGLFDSDEIEAVYADVRWRHQGSLHQLFGYPEIYQSWDLKELDPEQDALLFQVDEDDDAEMRWGDLARISFLVKKTDLENLDFENVRAAVDGS